MSVYFLKSSFSILFSYFSIILFNNHLSFSQCHVLIAFILLKYILIIIDMLILVSDFFYIKIFLVFQTWLISLQCVVRYSMFYLFLFLMFNCEHPFGRDCLSMRNQCSQMFLKSIVNHFTSFSLSQPRIHFMKVSLTENFLNQLCGIQSSSKLSNKVWGVVIV